MSHLRQKGFTIAELLVVGVLLEVIFLLSVGLFTTANSQLSASQDALDQILDVRTTFHQFRQDVRASQALLPRFGSEVASKSKLLLKTQRHTIIYAFELNKDHLWTLHKRIYTAGKMTLKQEMLTQLKQGYFTASQRQVILELTTPDQQKLSHVVGLR